MVFGWACLLQASSSRWNHTRNPETSSLRLDPWRTRVADFPNEKNATGSVQIVKSPSAFISWIHLHGPSAGFNPANCATPRPGYDLGEDYLKVVKFLKIFPFHSWWCSCPISPSFLMLWSLAGPSNIPTNSSPHEPPHTTYDILSIRRNLENLPYHLVI